MPFVKLDCGILNSTLWFERTQREIFLTALLMAEPLEILEPMPQIATRSLEFTGWSVPPGWYGFVPAAGIGILHRARVPETDESFEALASLGNPEISSRSQDFNGRRLVRVDGGYLILNYMKYRERDYTAADRSRRYRERKAAMSRRSVTTSRRNITQAEAEAEAEVHIQRGSTTVSNPRHTTDALTVGFADFWQAYPRKIGEGSAWNAWRKLQPDTDLVAKILRSIQAHREDPQWQKEGGQFIPHPSTFLNQRRFEDELTAPQPRVAESTSRLAQAVRDFSRS